MDKSPSHNLCQARLGQAIDSPPLLKIKSKYWFTLNHYELRPILVAGKLQWVQNGAVVGPVSWGHRTGACWVKEHSVGKVAFSLEESFSQRKKARGVEFQESGEFLQAGTSSCVCVSSMVLIMYFLNAFGLSQIHDGPHLVQKGVPERILLRTQVIQLFIFLIFWPYGVWDFSPPPGTEPAPPALKCRVSITGRPGKSLI